MESRRPARFPEPPSSSPPLTVPMLLGDERSRPLAASQQRTLGPGRRLTVYLLAVDLVALTSSLPLAIWLRSMFGPTGLPPFAQRPSVLGLVLLAIPFLVAYRLYDMDRRRLTISALSELSVTFHALALYAFLLVIVLASTGANSEWLSIGELVFFWLIAVVGIPVLRAAFRHSPLSKAVARQRTLIVGAGRVGQDVARRLSTGRQFNIEVIGFLDNDPQPIAADLAAIPVLGSEDDIVRVARELEVERVVLSFSRANHEHVLDILRHAGLHQLYVSIVPRFFEIMASNVELDDVGGVTVLDLQPARLSRPAMITKRSFDLAVCLVAAPVLAVVVSLIALAIKLDSPGPIFFRQPRMGRAGTTFPILKFRTMVDGAERQRAELAGLNELSSGPLFKLRKDPRITRVGGFLRRTSLDELPQLINVARGDMSLVGPRPFVLHEAEQIGGWARRRLDATPGMTGAWQVNGRNDMSFEEMVKLDYLYVANWSLGVDLRLLLQTPAAVLRSRGAY